MSQDPHDLSLPSVPASPGDAALLRLVSLLAKQAAREALADARVDPEEMRHAEDEDAPGDG